MQKQVYSAQDFGEVIRAARERKQLSQRDLAAQLGVTQAWVSSVERGNDKSQIAGVLRLVSFLEIDLIADLEGHKNRIVDIKEEYKSLLQRND